MVAVWDISTESPLLSKRTGKSYIIYPYHCFQAHIGVVSGMLSVRYGGLMYEDHSEDFLHTFVSHRELSKGAHILHLQTLSFNILPFSMALPHLEVRACIPWW